MQSLTKIFFLLFTLYLLSANLSAQVFLRLDEYGTTDAFKYYLGDRMEVKTTYYPDEWVKRRIVNFIPESNTIIFDEDFYTVDEIIAIRRGNSVPKHLGNAMWQFGLVWLTYGLILDLTGTDDIGWKNLSIGIGSAITGFTLKKFAAQKTYNIGSKYALRMIDVRMHVDP